MNLRGYIPRLLSWRWFRDDRPRCPVCGLRMIEQGGIGFCPRRYNAAHRLLARASHIRARLAEYYEPADIERWLTSPHKLLNDRKPCDLIAAGQASEVERLIDQLDSGAYL